MKKLAICIAACTATVFIAVILVDFLTPYYWWYHDSENPLRQSEDQLREIVLELTPMGTHMEEVVRLVEEDSLNRDWEIVRVSHHIGVSRGEVRGLELDVGEKSIRAVMGTYRALVQGILYEVFVCVWWGFDENAELIDVYVRKQT